MYLHWPAAFYCSVDTDTLFAVHILLNRRSLPLRMVRIVKEA